jgi:hypothetical protein
MPKLVDGREVPSDSPEWRTETLARWVLTLPLAKRREWLDDFEKKNPIAGQDLRQVVAVVHADKKRHKATKPNP